MKVHRYSGQQRRQWVYEMQHKLKTVKQICTEAVISRATLYNWVKECAAENNPTGTDALSNDSTPAWQPLDKHKMLLAALGKIDPEKKLTQKLVSELMKRYTLTVAQACDIAGIEASAYQYKPRKPEVPDRLVYNELVRLIAEDSLRSLDDCQAILHHTHPHWTRKQVKRVYRQGRLYLKRTRARSTRLLLAPAGAVPVAPQPVQPLQRPGAFWQAGALEGYLQNEPYWILYITDYSDGTPLNVRTGTGPLGPADVIDFLTMAAAENGAPKKMRVLAKPPFNGREVAKWIWANKVALYQLSLAKPENLLETGHLEDNIRHQLATGCSTTAQLAVQAAAWVGNFAANAGSTLIPCGQLVPEKV